MYDPHTFSWRTLARTTRNNQSRMLASPLPALSCSLVTMPTSLGKRQSQSHEDDIHSRAAQRPRREFSLSSPAFEFHRGPSQSAASASRSQADTPRLAPQRRSSEVSFASIGERLQQPQGAEAREEAHSAYKDAAVEVDLMPHNASTPFVQVRKFAPQNPGR